MLWVVADACLPLEESSSTKCNRRSAGTKNATKCVLHALPTRCRTLRPTLSRLRFVHPLSRLHVRKRLRFTRKICEKSKLQKILNFPPPVYPIAE